MSHDTRYHTAQPDSATAAIVNSIWHTVVPVTEPGLEGGGRWGWELECGWGEE